MIDVDYLHEPLDWHDKVCEVCGKDLERHAGNEPDPIVLHMAAVGKKGSILLCGDCRYKLSRLLS